MKRKKKGDIPSAPNIDDKRKPSSYRTVKCPLKAILRDAKDFQPKLNDLVVRCNDIVTETYQFIRLFVLKKYHSKVAIPEIDEKFILYCMKATGTRDNRGRQAVNSSLQLELETFYEDEYKDVLQHNDKHDLCNMSYLLPYLATQMHTGIRNNMKEHFMTRLLRFINKTVSIYDEDLTKEEKRKERTLLKNKLYDNETDVPDRYKEWFTTYRTKILPETFGDISLAYDVKADSSKYLPYTLYMNEVLEAKEFKLFQPLSLRNNIVPHYITIDTASLINLFADKGEKGTQLKKVKEYQYEVWNKYFKMDTKIFKQKNYHFNFTLQTDGIGCSLLFEHNDYTGKYCQNCSTDENYSYKYIDNYSKEETDKLKKRKIVGCDPGKLNMVYMADEDGNKLRYTALQRRTESMAKRNNRIMNTEKVKGGVIEKETVLSEYNSKTVNYERFKLYLKAKNKLNKDLKEFYLRDLFRKMKWRQFVYARKSEDKFVDRIEKTFGKPENVCIAYGDWSRSSQMRNFMPTQGIGLRKLISKRFLTISVNEFRTSKLCCDCHKELCYLHVQKENKDKKVFRCLTCKGCVSSESKNVTFVTRDLNSALNIRRLAVKWIEEQKRPEAFTQVKVNGMSSTTSFEVEKVGQSVDFTGLKSSN